MTKETIKEIEKKINSNRAYDVYQEYFKALFDIQLEIDWLGSKRGALAEGKLIGNEKVKERYNDRVGRVKAVKEKLNFIKKKYELR